MCYQSDLSLQLLFQLYVLFMCVVFVSLTFNSINGCLKINNVDQKMSSVMSWLIGSKNLKTNFVPLDLNDQVMADGFNTLNAHCPQNKDLTICVVNERLSKVKPKCQTESPCAAMEGHRWAKRDPSKLPINLYEIITHDPFDSGILMFNPTVRTVLKSPCIERN